MSPNGHGRGMVNTPMGHVPIVERKSNYRCPTCGDVPKAMPDGTPEGFKVNRGTVTFYLCLPCCQAWQNNMAQLMPFQVPRLKPIQET